MAWHGRENWIPQNAKDERIGSRSKAQDSTFYILVIQYHIESIGKANTIKRGMRCCLMAYLLKVLSDMLQSPQLLSHIHI